MNWATLVTEQSTANTTVRLKAGEAKIEIKILFRNASAQYTFSWRTKPPFFASDEKFSVKGLNMSMQDYSCEIHIDGISSIVIVIVSGNRMIAFAEGERMNETTQTNNC